MDSGQAIFGQDVRFVIGHAKKLLAVRGRNSRIVELRVENRQTACQHKAFDDSAREHGLDAIIDLIAADLEILANLGCLQRAANGIRDLYVIRKGPLHAEQCRRKSDLAQIELVPNLFLLAPVGRYDLAGIGNDDRAGACPGSIRRLDTADIACIQGHITPGFEHDACGRADRVAVITTGSVVRLGVTVSPSPVLAPGNSDEPMPRKRDRVTETESLLMNDAGDINIVVNGQTGCGLNKNQRVGDIRLTDIGGRAQSGLRKGSGRRVRSKPVTRAADYNVVADGAGHELSGQISQIAIDVKARGQAGKGVGKIGLVIPVVVSEAIDRRIDVTVRDLVEHSGDQMPVRAEIVFHPDFADLGC